MFNIDKAVKEAVKEDLKRLALIESLPKPRSMIEVGKKRQEEVLEENACYSTGWAQLDECIKGIVPRWLVTLASSSNSGKTSIMANIAVNVARQRGKVLYLALEPENMIASYIASVRTRKTYTELSRPENAFEFLNKELDGYIDVYGRADGVTKYEDMAKIIGNLPKHYDLIIIDHASYLTKGAGLNLTTAQSDTVMDLCDLSKQLGTAIWQIAVINKEGSKKRGKKQITTGDISGSGAIEYGSQGVLIMNRDYPADGDENSQPLLSGRLSVTKTKAGKNRSIPFTYFEDCAYIEPTFEAMGDANFQKLKAGQSLNQGDQQQLKNNLGMDAEDQATFDML